MVGVDLIVMNVSNYQVVKMDIVRTALIPAFAKRGGKDFCVINLIVGKLFLLIPFPNLVLILLNILVIIFQIQVGFQKLRPFGSFRYSVASEHRQKFVLLQIHQSMPAQLDNVDCTLFCYYVFEMYVEGQNLCRTSALEYQKVST